MELEALAGHQTPGTLSSLLPSADITGSCQHALLFTWALESVLNPHSCSASTFPLSHLLQIPVFLPVK